MTAGPADGQVPLTARLGQRFRLDRFELVPSDAGARPGTLFTDRVGPWYDSDGTEIVLPCSEAFERAVADLPGRWTVRSNIGVLDGGGFDLGMPELTLLAQSDWNRVTGPSPRRSFLLQIDGVGATIGRVCEQVVTEVMLDRVGVDAWPGTSPMATDDAVAAGLLTQVRVGSRSDDLTLVTESEQPVALLEVKGSIGRWSSLRRRIRDTAVRQLTATATANPHLPLELVAVAISAAQRHVGVFRLPDADLDDIREAWLGHYRDWRPHRPRPRHPRRPRADESDASHQRLRPGVHPTPTGPYSRVVDGQMVWAAPTAVGDPLAGGPGTWEDPLIATVLSVARTNPSIHADTLELLPWALGAVLQRTPDAVGLVGPADHSGPRASPWSAGLGHRTRGQALAAELVTAACLTYRAWPAVADPTVLGPLREPPARCDFGVKLLGNDGPRTTAEADILITTETGRRHAVDVKHTTGTAFANAPERSMLDVVEEALRRGEIDSFHFAANGRFTRAVHDAVRGRDRVTLHDNVWPGTDDLARIRRQQLQRVDHRTLANQIGSGPSEITAALFDLYADGYRRTFGDGADLRLIDVRGHTHLFDTRTDQDAGGTQPRLVAVAAVSGGEVVSRDTSFMRRFPLPTGPYDRGHAVARETGGPEGIGMNLVPQLSSTNRGRGGDGRGWRHLERRAAAVPGTFMVTRALYDDDTDVPAWLERVQIEPGSGPVVARFPNRIGLP